MKIQHRKGPKEGPTDSSLAARQPTTDEGGSKLVTKEATRSLDKLLPLRSVGLLWAINHPSQGSIPKQPCLRGRRDWGYSEVSLLQECSRGREAAREESGVTLCLPSAPCTLDPRN